MGHNKVTAGFGGPEGLEQRAREFEAAREELRRFSRGQSDPKGPTLLWIIVKAGETV